MPSKADMSELIKKFFLNLYLMFVINELVLRLSQTCDNKTTILQYLHKLYKVLRVVLVVLVPHLGMPTANLPAVGIYNFIR